MTNGTIKFFNAAKGYGFVTPDGGGPDIFLPSAAVTTVGAAAIKQGLRIAFEKVADVKGPKIVSLEILKEAPVAAAPVSATPQVTIYCKLDTEAAAEVIEAARGQGATLNLVDYMAVPPSMDQLKRLAQMVGVTGQSLVRRYDPMFLALQLDDRFISDQEFWTAIFEHPALINGPVIMAAGKAAVCKTAAEARQFLGGEPAKAAPAPKTLSPRIAAMLRGTPVPAVQQAPVQQTIVAPAPVVPKLPPSKKIVLPPRTVVAAKPVVAPKAVVAPMPKAVAKPAPAKKPAPKKADVKKPAPKPAKPVKKAKPARK